jgi:hypothetical protein
VINLDTGKSVKRKYIEPFQVIANEDGAGTIMVEGLVPLVTSEPQFALSRASVYRLLERGHARESIIRKRFHESAVYNKAAG